jgi:hypothetical protein
METIGFDSQIKPLFREPDRLEMDYAFDLWSYEDVKEWAKGIYERVADGTMPCDEPWETARVQLFRDWIDQGCKP